MNILEGMKKEISELNHLPFSFILNLSNTLQENFQT